MRSVRIFFQKNDRMKYISHLDMNRFMSRALRLSGIPIWYTEGFHPHPYLTFLLPLSLGFESDYEMMDIRVLDDNFGNENVRAALQPVLPEYIKIFKVAEAQQKPGKIAYSSYRIDFKDLSDKLYQKLGDFLKQEEILTQKVGKKGKVKELNLAEKITDCKLTKNGESATLYLTLPAGGADNVNPTLLLKAFGELPFYRIRRTAVLDAEKNLFE